MPHVYELILLIACIGCVTTATSILVRDPDEPMNRYASAIVYGGGFWAFCEILWNRTEDPELAMLLVKLSALGWIAIGPLGLQLLHSMSGRPKRQVRTLVRTLYAAAAMLLLVDWTTPWIHTRVVSTDWGWSYELGPAYLSFYLITIVSLISGMSVLGFDIRHWTSRGERAQGVGIIVAISIPLVVASLTDGVLPLFGVHVWHLGTASIALLGAVVTWTFHRHGYSLLAPGTFAREILETLPDGVLLLHLDGRVRRANPVMIEFAGARSAEDLIGLPVGDLFDGHVLLDEEIRHEIEMRVTPISGVAQTLTGVSTRKLMNRLDEPTGLVVVARDLTEIENLRKRVLIGGRMAAVGQLAAGVAHELNNPMSYVRANLSLLLKHWEELRMRTSPEFAIAGVTTPQPGPDAPAADNDLLWDEGTELIGESLEGIERAASIVRDIRTFSHGGSHEREPTDLIRLLDATLRIATPQLKHHVRVERHDEELPVIECAPREIQQVFLNLILNAVDATPASDTGELPRLSIESSADGRNVRIRVCDEGEGIPADCIDCIFDPFFTTKPAGKGTGLGLALSYEIVRRHGGEISVQSEPGQGACFTVVLPRPANG